MKFSRAPAEKDLFVPARTSEEQSPRVEGQAARLRLFAAKQRHIQYIQYFF
jgi:hypothetical protein